MSLLYKYPDLSCLLYKITVISFKSTNFNTNSIFWYQFNELPKRNRTLTTKPLIIEDFKHNLKTLNATQG